MKIKTSNPECIWESNTILGEGTLWVKSHNSIYFVDIKRKKIFILNTKNKKKKILKINKEIGFLSHIKNNIFILGLKGELRIVNLKTRKIIKSIIVEKNKTLNRLNDGKTDPKGRLWFGSMDNLERKIRTGSLYCLDNNLNLTEVDKNYYITNGPAFINSENFYHTDSRDKKIYKIKIDKKLKIIKKKVFIKFKSKEGSPDGMTLDKQNNLWTCHFGGARISVFNKTGKKIHTIDFPAKNITNCTFGGPNHSELFVTSAKKSMSKKDLRQFKLSGSLFRIKTNVNGSIAKRFNYNI